VGWLVTLGPWVAGEIIGLVFGVSCRF